MMVASSDSDTQGKSLQAKDLASSGGIGLELLLESNM